MTPSVALTRAESSTMGGIVEQIVLRDYLKECSQVPPFPFSPPVVTSSEWWDTGNQQHYKDILLTRHKHISEKQLREMKNLRVPDISTWDGRYQRNRVLVPGHGDKRNEVYEVKPDNVWGEIAGKKKLEGMARNFLDLGVSGYSYGSWYPDPPGPQRVARKRMSFEHYAEVIASFHYRMRRMARSLKNIGRTLNVRDVVIEIERREAGLLYYMICIKMQLDFKGEEAVAKKVVQRLYQALTTGLKEKEAKLELEFAQTLVAAGRDRKPRPPQPPDPETDQALRVIAQEEEFQIGALDIVDELANSVASLGQTLFTNLRGLPGERFLVCCDEVYFNNEILNPRRARQARTLQPLQVRPPLILGSRLAAGGAMVKVAAPVLATLYVVGKLNSAPQEIFSAKDEWRKARDWLEQHPALTLVVGSVVFYGTALLLAGGGATLAAALYGEGAVATIGASGLQPGLGLCRGLASPALAPASLPAMEVQAGVQVGTRAPVQVVQRLAAAEAEALIQQQVRSIVREEVERVLAKQAAKQFAQKVIQQAIADGGRPLASVVARMALPGGPRSGAQDDAAAGEAAPVAIEVGSLFLLKAKDELDPKGLPQQLQEYDYTAYSFEAPGPDLIAPGGSARLRKVRHLGLLQCS